MATLLPRSQRPAIEAQVLAIARDLLRELGNSAAISALSPSAHLERDLGLGSIERVELITRLEKSLGPLPEYAAESTRIEELVTAAVGRSTGKDDPPVEPVPAGGATIAESSAAAIEPGLSHAGLPTSSYELGAQRGGAPLFQRASEKIYGVYAAAIFLIWLVFSWLVVLLMPPGRPAARMTSAALRIYFRIIGCRLTLHGGEHLDKCGAAIYVSNHTSYADVLAVMALFQVDYHFVAKSEINDMLFIGTFLRKIGHFAFERGKLRARSRQAERMEKALLRGESVFVFAEGTFTAEPGVRPFQLGAFRAAVKTGRPIVPLALRGARQFLRDGTFLPKPSQISVVVCPPLFPSPTEGREWAEVLRLRDDTRSMIARLAGEPLR
jgi:1-acyl-sn-glycerol-3-phosphate acyltransferase